MEKINNELEVIKTYYVNGELKERYEVIKNTDTKHGYYFYYLSNGNIKEKSNYVNGELHGRYASYSEGGKLIKTGNYVNGIKEGKWFFYGIRAGESFFYCESLDILEKCYYVNGKLHGKCILYNESGKELKKEIWKNGVLISNEQF